MKNLLLTLTFLSLLGCNDSPEEFAFFPVSKECKPNLEQFLKDTSKRYGAEGGKVYAQFDYFKLNLPVPNPYIASVKIYGEKLSRASMESVANASTAFCARTESMESEDTLIGFRGLREYLLNNLNDGETASVKKQGNKIVVSVTK